MQVYIELQYSTPEQNQYKMQNSKNSP